MRYTFFTLLIGASIFLLPNCKTETTKTKANATEILLSSIHKVQLLDSVAASHAIIRDDLEYFFDKMTPIDAMIQMRQQMPPDTKRDEVISAYQGFLQRDVGRFSQDETEFIAKAMNEAFQLCQKVSEKFFPDDILLIKSHGKPYGEDAYYTRENIIVVPEQALKKKNYDEFLRVMLHEISHIVTRTHPSVKAQLYALIGFKKIEGQLVINDSLRQRLLTNPDGIDMNWVTTLTAADNKSVFAVPLLYAKNATVSAMPSEFFANMGFNYFELAPNADGKSFDILTRGAKQQSTLDTQGINALFKANYNTEYIIHPDEIVADNFAILMLLDKKPSNLATYTEGGQTLLNKMKAVLAQ